jgi:hypothetical protein
MPSSIARCSMSRLPARSTTSAADALGDRHDFVHRHSAVVAGPTTRLTAVAYRIVAPSSISSSAPSARERFVVRPVRAGCAQLVHSFRARRCAATQESAAGDQVRLDAHVDRGASVSRRHESCAGGQHEVTGDRRVGGDARGLGARALPPMKITSGSARRMERSAPGNVTPARVLIWICLRPSRRYSTGSSNRDDALRG